MGSSGTGRFSDYSGSSKDEDGGGGSSGNDPCELAFNTDLEEVERCDYYIANGTPPPDRTIVSVNFEKRANVVTKDGLLVGYLPTKFNYLRACIANGHSYDGVVNSTSTAPVVLVNVDITPS